MIVDENVWVQSEYPSFDRAVEFILSCRVGQWGICWNYLTDTRILIFFLDK